MRFRILFCMIFYEKRGRKQAINIFFIMTKNICIHGDNQLNDSVFSQNSCTFRNMRKRQGDR